MPTSGWVESYIAWIFLIRLQVKDFSKLITGVFGLQIPQSAALNFPQ
jgi:hypothetical protein